MAYQTEFYNWLILKRQVSVGTAKRHIWTLSYLLKNVNEFDSLSLTSFLTLKKSEGCRNTYLNHIVGTAKVYTLYLQQENKAYDAEILSLKDLKEEPYERATFSDEEIESFLSLSAPVIRHKYLYKGIRPMTREYTPNRRSWAKYTMFFTVLAFTGARPHEIAKLTIDDVDWGRNCLTVHEYKTGHQGNTRLVPISQNIAVQLKEYISTLSGEYLFPAENRLGTRKYINNVDWCCAFHKRLKRLGIKRRNLTVYSFRHSMATRLLEQDVSLFKIQKLLGHKKLETTAIYSHLTTKDVQMAISKHPLVVKQSDPYTMLKVLKEYIDSLQFADNPHFKYSLRLDEKSLYLEVTVK